MKKDFEVPLLVDFNITAKTVDEAKRIAVSCIKKVDCSSDVEVVGKPNINTVLKLTTLVKDVDSITDAKNVAIARLGKNLPNCRIISL